MKVVAIYNCYAAFFLLIRYKKDFEGLIYLKKDILDLNTLIRDYNFLNELFKSLCFVLFSGLFIFWRAHSLSNNLNNILFESILILIGIYFLFNSIWDFIYSIREYCLIKNGNIVIYIDNIIDKQKVFKYDEYDEKQHRVRLSQYTCLTDKYYCIPSTEDFKNARINSECILIFTKLNKAPLISYLGDYCTLDDDLKEKVTDNLKNIIK